MSAEPDMTATSAELDEIARKYELEAGIRRSVERGIERAAWASLWRSYERCVEIAELVWSSRLDGDMKAQQALAIEMRDRELRFRVEGSDFTMTDEAATVLASRLDASIPVPLFTPRDRAQFIKEAAATLLISADRKNLSVRFPKEKPDAPEEQEAASQPGVEAASGTSEGEMEPETPVTS